MTFIHALLMFLWQGDYSAPLASVFGAEDSTTVDFLLTLIGR